MFNTLPTNLSKSRISEGCFFLICSFFRYNIEKVPLEHDCGVDYRMIRQILRHDKLVDMGIVLEFQLKSTQDYIIRDVNIIYDLDSKAYNNIVQRNVEQTTPIILILMALPNNEDDWISFEDEAITLKKNLFWYHTDAIELIENENTTRRIEIPLANRLTLDSFTQVIQTYSVTRRR